MNVEFVKRGLWFVESGTSKGVWYRVSTSYRTCSCPAGRRHSTVCKHLKDVLEREAMLARFEPAGEPAA